MFSREVFISYKAEDYDEAAWVKEQFEREGISCWMAPTSIPGGSSYAVEIPKAVRNCTVFVVILSARAQTSIWIPREIDQAINQGRTVLPYMIENCALNDEFSFYLANVQHYEAWRNRQTAFQEMLKDVQDIIGQKRQTQSDGRFQTQANGHTAIKTPSQETGGRKKGEGKLSVKRFFPVLVVICLMMGWLLYKSVSEDKTDQGEISSSSISYNVDDVQTYPDIESGKEQVEVQDEAIDDKSEQNDTNPTDIEYNTKGCIRILNKKNDRDLEFERLALRFKEESGIDVSVESPGPAGYSTALREQITESSSDPTLFMLGGRRDFEKYGMECLDLSDSPLMDELEDDEMYALRGDNGKIYGIGCFVEAYGLVVNTRLLQKAGYEIDDIQSFDDLKKITEDITSRKNEIGFAAFSSASIDGDGYYRFSEHAPNVPLYYEIKDHDFNVRFTLKGTYLNEFRDFMDLYLENATVPSKDAVGRGIADAQNDFLLEKAVFHQDGSWNADDIKGIIEDQAAIIPLYMGMPGEDNQGLCKTCSYYWCVNKYASADDIEASLQFLQWLVMSEEGTSFVAKEMDFQMPYKKAKVPDNIFLKTLHENEEQGLETISQYYKNGEDTAWSNAINNALSKYASESGGWEEVQAAFETLW